MKQAHAFGGAPHDRRARLLAQPIERDLCSTPPPALHDIVSLLQAPGEVDLDAVVVALQNLRIDSDALGDAVCADRTAYVRTLLHRDQRAELLALTWMQGQSSPLHDHGASTCIVRVAAGQAEEHLYRARSPSEPRRAYLRRTLKPGVVMRSPGDVAHTLGNAGPELLVTLHVYAPPLQR
jgi:predicted metal-dependent enzyme (double-stranded beta helix superfamily)